MPRAEPSLDAAELAARVRRATGAADVQLGEREQVLWGGYGEIRRAVLRDREDEGTRAAVVKCVRPPAERSLNADPAMLRSHRRKLRSYQVEATFYELHATHSAARVPAAFALSDTPGGWLFVLEDLDAAGFGARRTFARPGDAELCLEWLARFHAGFLFTPPEGLWKHGTYWHLATRPDELARMRDPRLKRAAAAIDARLNAAAFKTLVHGDAKLENFCFTSRGTDVAAVDFQYVGGGVGMKDVAYLLSCCEGQLTSARESALLNGYFATLRRELAQRRVLSEPAELDALEVEWRALYPFAIADFQRFLLGWAPHATIDAWSDRNTRSVLTQLEA